MVVDIDAAERLVDDVRVDGPDDGLRIAGRTENKS